MSLCRICSRLLGKSRGELMDYGLRKMYAKGPREAFLAVRDRLTGRVLEIGCGPGVLFGDYPPGARVIGIEPDLDFLRVARRAAVDAPATIDVLGGDAQRLSFADASFNAAVVHLVLCSVPDARRAVGELLRVVQPGGLIYVYEHVASENGLYRAFQNLTDPIQAWLGEGCHWNRDTGELVREADVDIEHRGRTTLYAWPTPPLPIVRILARRRSA